MKEIECVSNLMQVDDFVEVVTADPGHFRNNRPARVEEEQTSNLGKVLLTRSPVEIHKPAVDAVLSATRFDTTAVGSFRNLDCFRNFVSAEFRPAGAAGCKRRN